MHNTSMAAIRPDYEMINSRDDNGDCIKRKGTQIHASAVGSCCGRLSEPTEEEYSMSTPDRQLSSPQCHPARNL
jgi:hypothetical protein